MPTCKNGHRELTYHTEQCPVCNLLTCIRDVHGELDVAERRILELEAKLQEKRDANS